MFFRRRRLRAEAGPGWAEQLEELGFSRLPEGAGALRDSIDVQSTPLLSGVYGAEPTAGLSTRIFEFRSDRLSGSVPVAAFGCVLLAEEPFCPVGLRFSRKLPPQLEEITAASNQAVLLRVAADDAFSGQISVLARHPQEARHSLSSSVRRAVLGIAGRNGEPFVLAAGGDQLFLQMPAGNAGPELPGHMLTDLLTLWTAFRSTGARPVRPNR